MQDQTVTYNVHVHGHTHVLYIEMCMYMDNMLSIVSSSKMLLYTVIQYMCDHMITQ